MMIQYGLLIFILKMFLWIFYWCYCFENAGEKLVFFFFYKQVKNWCFVFGLKGENGVVVTVVVVLMGGGSSMVQRVSFQGKKMLKNVWIEHWRVYGFEEFFILMIFLLQSRFNTIPKTKKSKQSLWKFSIKTILVKIPKIFDQTRPHIRGNLLGTSRHKLTLHVSSVNNKTWRRN